MQQRLRNHSPWRAVWDGLQRTVTPTPWPAQLATALGASHDVIVERHDVVWPSQGPRASAVLRIAFASDFHAGPITSPRLIENAVRHLSEADADLLLLGGDFVSLRTSDLTALLEMLQEVPARLGRFAVLGNHDYWTDAPTVARRLESVGIELLINRSRRLPAPFGDVSVCGLDDHTTGAPDADAAFRDAGPVRIVLMHAPSGLVDIGEHPFDLALCGHTHGGQIALPNGRPIIVGSGSLSRRYSAGRFDLSSGRVIVVSRGIVCGTLPVRWNAPSDVILCTIRPQELPREL